MRRLKLEKPLAFFDLETTGANIAEDKIITYAVLIMHPDGAQTSFSGKLNPGRPIRSEATKVHGISDDDIKDCPFFNEVAGDLFNKLKDCDLAGYNSDMFDIPLLSQQLFECGYKWPLPGTKTIDVCTIFKIMNPRTLSAAFKYYVGGDLENAHDAEADNSATFSILFHQLNKHSELPDDVSGLSEFCAQGRQRLDLTGKFSKDADGDYIFNFGKHKGEKITEKNLNYLTWMIDKANFHWDTTEWAQKIYNEISGNFYKDLLPTWERSK